MLLDLLLVIISIMSDMWNESKEKMTRALVRAGIIADPREKVLQDWEVQYPPGEVYRGFLPSRARWMDSTAEFWQYVREEPDKSGVVAIMLEGWTVSRTCHQLVQEYGQLFATKIEWGGFVISLNIAAVHDFVDIVESPSLIEAGFTDKAYVIHMSTWNKYRDFVKDQREEDDEWIPVGKRLLFHCLIDKMRYPYITLENFRQWPAASVMDWKDLQRPGMFYLKNSPDSVGLGEGGDENQIPGESLLAEVSVEDEDGAILACGEPEKVASKGEKSKEKIEDVPDNEGSPLLAQPNDRRHDMDEQREMGCRHRANKRRRRRQGRKARRARKNKVQLNKETQQFWAPTVITREQEANIVRLLVLSANPTASEEVIQLNIEEQHRARYRRTQEEGFGDKFGEWKVSDDVAPREGSRFPFPSPGAEANVTQSSVYSPRAELSQNLSSLDGESDLAGQQNSSSLGLNVFVDDLACLVSSPILVRRRSSEEVVTVSSDTASGSSTATSQESVTPGRRPTKRSRMSLSSLMNSGLVSFPDNGLMANILVDVDQEMSVDEDEVDEEVFEEPVTGDSNQDQQKGMPSLDDN